MSDSLTLRNNPELRHLRRRSPSASRAYHALRRYFRQLRGDDPVAGAGTPATTLGDVRELAALWSLDVVDWALAGELNAGDRKALQLWQVCLRELLTTPGPAEQRYPFNGGVWTCLQALARSSDNRLMRHVDVGGLE